MNAHSAHQAILDMISDHMLKDIEESHCDTSAALDSLKRSISFIQEVIDGHKKDYIDIALFSRQFSTVIKNLTKLQEAKEHYALVENAKKINL